MESAETDKFHSPLRIYIHRTVRRQGRSTPVSKQTYTRGGGQRAPRGVDVFGNNWSDGPGKTFFGARRRHFVLSWPVGHTLPVFPVIYFQCRKFPRGSRSFPANPFPSKRALIKSFIVKLLSIDAKRRIFPRTKTTVYLQALLWGLLRAVIVFR